MADFQTTSQTHQQHLTVPKLFNEREREKDRDRDREREFSGNKISSYLKRWVIKNRAVNTVYLPLYLCPLDV